MHIPVREAWQSPQIIECLPSLHDAGLPSSGFRQVKDITPILGLLKLQFLTLVAGKTASDSDFIDPRAFPVWFPIAMAEEKYDPLLEQQLNVRVRL